MTNTEITCITHKYKAGSAKIMLTIRGTDNAICHDSTDNCKFTYDEAITPMITDAYKEIYKQTFDDIITFTGTNLLGSSSTNDVKKAILILNNDYFINSTSQTATELTFKLSDIKIQAGKYLMRIYIKHIGKVLFKNYD